MPKNQKFLSNGKRGFGLIFSIILLFVVLGMVISLSSIAVLDAKMSQKTKSSVGTFFNSESGVEWALNKIASSSGTISYALSDLDDSAISENGSINYSPEGNCLVYFLDESGRVIKKSEFGEEDIADVRAVRSVGIHNEENRRAIEAAVPR